ncbi:MAG: hypothetical protein IKX34_08780 [Bacteroidales bacterium]|nr:hypothetical protein [Bacteroidales bacterium]
MKSIKYLVLAVVVVLFAGCQVHEIEFAESESCEGKAQFQIFYAEPITNNTTNRIDSVFVNGKLYNSIEMPQKLTVNAVIPYPNGYYVAPAGMVNIKFYRGAEANGSAKLVYETSVNLPERKQMILVYDLNADPIILDDEYPYEKYMTGATSSTFDTDSVVTYRFINMFFEKPGVPYSGKLQYQYSNNSGSSYTAGDWHNLGDPIGFGEQTARCPAIVHKTVFNSSGYQTLRFRCVDPDTGVTVTRTTDYWTAYIGRINTHVLRGCMTGSPSAGYTQIINNVQ